MVATFSEIKGLRFGELTFYSLLYWHTILSLQEVLHEREAQSVKDIRLPSPLCEHVLELVSVLKENNVTTVYMYMYLDEQVQTI